MCRVFEILHALSVIYYLKMNVRRLSPRVCLLLLQNKNLSPRKNRQRCDLRTTGIPSFIIIVIVLPSHCLSFQTIWSMRHTKVSKWLMIFPYKLVLQCACLKMHRKWLTLLIISLDDLYFFFKKRIIICLCRFEINLRRIRQREGTASQNSLSKWKIHETRYSPWTISWVVFPRFYFVKLTLRACDVQYIQQTHTNEGTEFRFIIIWKVSPW